MSTARKKIHEQLTKGPIQTEYGVDIRERITEELTSFFKEEPEAKKVALQTRSYHYPCFTAGRLVGYAVPK